LTRRRLLGQGYKEHQGCDEDERIEAYAADPAIPLDDTHAVRKLYVKNKQPRIAAHAYESRGGKLVRCRRRRAPLGLTALVDRFPGRPLPTGLAHSRRGLLADACALNGVRTCSA